MTRTDLHPQGIGIGYRPTHYRWIAEHKPKVSWFEVVTENFLSGGGRPRRFLESLRQDYPIVFHGVGLSLGSLDPFHPEYLKRWQQLINDLEPAMVSDHLCWTTYNGTNSHDLLPVPYTNESLAHISKRISIAQDLIKRPLLIENPSMYVAFADNDMSEAEFLRELCVKTGCKLLLDLNNLYVNHCNAAVDMTHYLETIPSESVAQFHLAGHSVETEVRIDTHDHPVCDEVWDLYGAASQRWPQVPTLLEWDDKIPEFPEMLAVREQAQKVVDTYKTKIPDVKPSAVLPTISVQTTSNPPSLDHVQKSMMRLITSPSGIDAHADVWPIFSDQIPVPRHVGLNVYNQAYYLRIRDNLKDIFSALYYLCEDDGFSAIVAGYLEAMPPDHFNIKFTGERFAEYIETGAFDFDFGVPPTVLADVARLEWAHALIFDHANDDKALTLTDLSALDANAWETITLQVKQAAVLIKTTYDAQAMIEAASNETAPPEPVAGEHYYLVHRVGEHVRTEVIDHVNYQYLYHLKTSVPLQDAARLASGALKVSASDAAARLPQLLSQWCTWGVLTGYRI